jgi:hypothetical protein
MILRMDMERNNARRRCLRQFRPLVRGKDSRGGVREGIPAQRIVALSNRSPTPALCEKVDQETVEHRGEKDKPEQVGHPAPSTQPKRRRLRRTPQGQASLSLWLPIDYHHIDVSIIERLTPTEFCLAGRSLKTARGISAEAVGILVP